MNAFNEQDQRTPSDDDVVPNSNVMTGMESPAMFRVRETVEPSAVRSIRMRAGDRAGSSFLNGLSLEGSRWKRN